MILNLEKKKAKEKKKTDYTDPEDVGKAREDTEKLDEMIEVVLNDRLGTKCRVKCMPSDTIGDLKLLAAAQLGVKAEKLRIQKWYNVYKDQVTLHDYET
eukprot:UN03877